MHSSLWQIPSSRFDVLINIWLAVSLIGKLVHCSVLTPYYKEDVLFSSQALEDQNEDGVSILFYLQKIYPGSLEMSKYRGLHDSIIPLKSSWISKYFLFLGFLVDEWKHFLQRVDCNTEEELRETEQLEDELRLWASYRGQTLTRTGIFSSILCHSFYILFSWEQLSDSNVFRSLIHWQLLHFLTVRGMMYYRQALVLQAFLDMARDEGIS